MAVNPLEALKDTVAPTVIVTDPDELEAASTDWRGKYRGQARAIVRPRSVDEVSAILAWATETRTPIIPQGGNTGLSGGATPDGSGGAVVLQLNRLNTVRQLDTRSATITVEAGCVLAEVQQRAREVDRLFPLSLGSEGSCQIGGTIATNAGGINVLRYGTMRDLVLGLEYVLPDGRVVSKLKGLRKNNAGYDLQQLIVGSEGTLAVITAATLKLFPLPRRSATAICGLQRPEHALTLLGLLQAAAGERVSSYELMCNGEMALIRRLMPDLPQPLADRHEWYLFIETTDADPKASLLDMLENVLATGFDRGLIDDAVLAQTEAQSRFIWHLRFAVSECNRRAGFTVSHDTSVAVDDVPGFLAAAGAKIEEAFPGAQPLFVGHMGDGNIHVNVLFATMPDPERRLKLTAEVNDCIFDIVEAFGGSITAEHGIGQALRDRLPDHAGPAATSLMRGVKQLFDPLNILNPGKLFAPA